MGQIENGTDLRFPGKKRKSKIESIYFVLRVKREQVEDN
jgi:hypothetical protein